MASEQEDLLKALRGKAGREQVNVEFGQVGLRPTIERGGQYQVQVQSTPRSNSALQLAEALQGGSQLLNNFVNVQSKQGEIEANALSPADVVKYVEQGDPNAMSFLDKLGKEKTFAETAYKRYYTGTVQPSIAALERELSSKPAHEWAAEGITTPEEYEAFVNSRINDVTGSFQEYTKNSPYAQAMHNQFLEEVVPKVVQQQVTSFDAKVDEFTKEQTVANLVTSTPENGVELSPLAGTTLNNAPQAKITTYGATGKNGSKRDPLLDTNSANAIGFRVSKEEQAKIKAGLPSEYKLVAGDIAVSPDIRANFEAKGVKPGDYVNLKLADGTTHRGRWMDITADEFAGKKLTGRFDLYTPSGVDPRDGKQVLGWIPDKETSDRNAMNNVDSILQINANSLAAAGFSPAKSSELLRENLLTQAKTKATSGDYVESRRLLEMIRDSKIGGQPLWGSADAQLQLASMEDLIDQSEDKESASNSKQSAERVDNSYADAALQITALPIDKQTAALAEWETKIRESGLTASEQVKVLERLDNLATSEEARAVKAATQGSLVDDYRAQVGGSASVWNTASGTGSTPNAVKERLSALPPEVKSLYMGQDEFGAPVLKENAYTAYNAALNKVLTQKSAENLVQHGMIGRGETFTYSVDGKDTVFTGTQDKTEQLAQARQLAELLDKDINFSLGKELMERGESFKPQGDEENNLPPRVREKNAIVKDLVSKGVSEGRAEEEARKQIQQQYGANSLVQKDGNIKKGPGVFENSSDMVNGYINDVQSKVYADTTKAEEAFLVAKYHSNISSGNLVKAIDSNPIAAVKELDDLNNQFKEVGIPWDAVKSGYVTFDKPTFEVTAYGDPSFIRGYYAIDSLMKQENSESNYQLIPLNILKNRTKPEAVGSLQSVADRWYGGDVKGLVAGQLKWYANHGIELK